VKKREKKLSDDAENNTAVANGDSVVVIGVCSDAGLAWYEAVVPQSGQEPG